MRVYRGRRRREAEVPDGGPNHCLSVGLGRRCLTERPWIDQHRTVHSIGDDGAVGRVSVPRGGFSGRRDVSACGERQKRCGGTRGFVEQEQGTVSLKQCVLTCATCKHLGDMQAVDGTEGNVPRHRGVKRRPVCLVREILLVAESGRPASGLAVVLQVLRDRGVLRGLRQTGFKTSRCRNLVDFLLHCRLPN